MDRDALLDAAVGAVRRVVVGRGLCLPTSVLLQRILSLELPDDRFTLRLGGLRVTPDDPSVEPVAYDPRGPEGIDGGFHAWLEDRHGMLHDPSITATLAADGYDVDPDSRIECAGRDFPAFAMRFAYEVLPSLQLRGEAEAETCLAAMLHQAITGSHPLGMRELVCPLDVAWA